MMNEVRTSRIEFQTLQANKEDLDISVEKTEKNAQDSLAELQKLQLEHQMLKTKRDDLCVSYENLSVEKDQLQSKVVELETEKATTGEREKQYKM